MIHDNLLVQPMREEVTRLGLRELRTAAEVDRFLNDARGTALVFVNSDCDCAAGNARPALAMALSAAGPRPDQMATVFAGLDLEATSRLRSNYPEIAASSPSVYLLKRGRLVMHLPRLAIETRAAGAVAAELSAALQQYCDTPSRLAQKKCIPCSGGVPTLSTDEIARLAVQVSAWQIVTNHHLRRVWTFPDFAAALAFVNRIGEVAEREGHHPDLLLTWGKVEVEIYTHKVAGLTESDFILAAKLDEVLPA